MAKGGKMKTSTKVALGVGGAAAVGGIGYFLWSRYKEKKDFDAEQQLAASQEVSREEAEHRDVHFVPAPVATKAVVSHWQGAGQSSVKNTAFTAAPRVPVMVIVKPPKARLHIDEQAWNANPTAKLLQHFRDGDVVSLKKAMGIIQWQCTGTSTPTQMKISGTSIPVQSPLPPKSIFYKKIIPGDRKVEVMLDTPAMLVGGTFDFVAAGFTEVDLVPDLPLNGATEGMFISMNRQAQLSLSPGSYLIIARMERLAAMFVEPYKYLKGYWSWTKNGPNTKSCSTQKRYLVNRKCPNHITSFGRTVRYDTWDDIAFVVNVDAQGSPITVQPMFDIAIGNYSYYRNDYSNKIGRYCRILNDYTGDNLRRWIANIAGWVGC
jgi:hypothetical protein